MKKLICFAVLCLLMGNVFAGPIYTHAEGVKWGDKVKNQIPLKDRIYVYLRSTSKNSEDWKRARSIPVKILSAKNNKKISDVIKNINGIFPKNYPSKVYLIFYRKDNFDGNFTALLKSNAGNYEVKRDKKKLESKVLPRDVFFIGRL